MIVSLIKTWIGHEYSLSSSNSDLEGRALEESKLLSNQTCQLCRYVATSISEGEPIFLDIRQPKEDFIFVDFPNEFGGGEQLSSSCIPFENVFLRLKISHILDDYIFIERKVLELSELRE